MLPYQRIGACSSPPVSNKWLSRSRSLHRSFNTTTKRLAWSNQKAQPTPTGHWSLWKRQKKQPKYLKPLPGSTFKSIPTANPTSHFHLKPTPKPPKPPRHQGATKDSKRACCPPASWIHPDTRGFWCASARTWRVVRSRKQTEENENISYHIRKQNMKKNIRSRRKNQEYMTQKPMDTHTLMTRTLPTLWKALKTRKETNKRKTHKKTHRKPFNPSAQAEAPLFPSQGAISFSAQAASSASSGLCLLMSACAAALVFKALSCFGVCVFLFCVVFWFLCYFLRWF